MQRKMLAPMEVGIMIGPAQAKFLSILLQPYDLSPEDQPTLPPAELEDLRAQVWDAVDQLKAVVGDPAPTDENHVEEE